jgi:hypothetical protein
VESAGKNRGLAAKIGGRIFILNASLTRRARVLLFAGDCGNQKAI